MSGAMKVEILLLKTKSTDPEISEPEHFSIRSFHITTLH